MRAWKLAWVGYHDSVQKTGGDEDSRVRGEPKSSRLCSKVVPPVERVEEKRNEGHGDGRRPEGRVQAEMQVQLQIRCSFP